MKYLPLLLLLSGTCFAEWHEWVLWSSSTTPHYYALYHGDKEISSCSDDPSEICNKMLQNLIWMYAEGRRNCEAVDSEPKMKRKDRAPINYDKLCGGSCGEDGK